MLKKRQALQQMMLGKLDIHIYKTETRLPSLILYKKSIQNGSKNLNLGPETLKLLQENTRRYRYRPLLSEQDSNCPGNKSKN
jgi:hypothetical protein